MAKRYLAYIPITCQKWYVLEINRTVRKSRIVRFMNCSVILYSSILVNNWKSWKHRLWPQVPWLTKNCIQLTKKCIFKGGCLERFPVCGRTYQISRQALSKLFSQTKSYVVLFSLPLYSCLYPPLPLEPLHLAYYF